MENITKQEVLAQLLYFTGSEKMWEHRTPFGKLLLTDGCNYVRGLGSRWLFDLLQSYQGKLKNEEFQCWTLKRTKGNEFVAVCDDGNDNELVRQVIPFSDFVLDEIRIWLIDGICLLPSEY